MPEEGRITAWSSWDEWKFVYKLLYSYGNIEAQAKGVDMVNMWKSNIRQGTLPISIDITSSLVSVYLQNLDEISIPFEFKQLASAMAIVRFVNGITDQLQTGLYAQSVQIIAEKINIPDWMVDLRHESTHARLPSIELLKSGIIVALEWLDENYWNETETKINEKERSLVEDTFANIFEYCDVVLSVIISKEKHKSAKDGKKFERKQEDRCKEISSKLLKSSHAGNLHHVVKTLVQEGCFVLNQKWYNVLKFHRRNSNYMLSKNEICEVEELVTLWKPIFLTLQEEYPIFIKLVCKELFLQYQQNKSMENRFSVLLSIFIILKMQLIYPGLVLKFIIQNPSKLSFQLLHYLLTEHAFDTKLGSKLESFYNVFVQSIEFINNKKISESSNLNYTKEQNDIIMQLKNSSTVSNKKSDLQFSSKWMLVTEEQLEKLPPIGKFKENHCLYKFKGSDKKLISEDDIIVINDDAASHTDINPIENNLSFIIDHLFSRETIHDVDDFDGGTSSVATNEYQLDQTAPWEMNVDFKISEEEEKMLKKQLQENISNTYPLKNIDTVKISFF